jgi:hypothetical protein
MSNGADTPVTRETIDSDLMVMVGGGFTPASLGPDAYNEILERARANANAYLDAFEERFLGPRFDAKEQSNLQLPHVLELLSDAAPERARDLAERLLRQYDAVLVVHDSADQQALSTVLPDHAMSLLYRLDDRRRELQRLLG